MLFADVILPLPLDRLFTYSVPSGLNVHIGSRVIVQFGRKKFYTAIVADIYEKEIPETEGIKEINSVLDDYPFVLKSQLEFWKWIAFYYMSSIGDVYKAALPSALKLESESFIQKNNIVEELLKLTPTEEKIYYTIPEKKPVKISDISTQAGISNIVPYINTLVEKKLISLAENIQNNYSPKTETIISLVKEFSEEELHSILDNLKKAKKQYELLLFFLHLREESVNPGHFSISKKFLLEKSQVSSSILDALIQKGILCISKKEISRFEYGDSQPEKSKKLNNYQTEAYKKIKQSFEEKPVTLLHGVTSSGKTEIYIQLIKDCIARGGQVLYLLPEIALTTQITERLKSVFGNKLSIYHSRLNDNERAETWINLLLKDQTQIILGARSAIFLPFKNLKLIIVDEEHESSYKQHDPAPRYNARDAAIVLGNIINANVLLGTATPAIETYYNVKTGKYGLVTLTNRYGDIELPLIEVVDTKELRRKKQMKSVLSPLLIREINDALSNKKQSILFQNRRGFAPLLECKVCAWTPRCEHCDVSLTYHKGQRTMICHYCGTNYQIPEQCPNCETSTLEILGYGTERIEEDAQNIFPEATVVRMDMDTTRNKHAFENIIANLESGKTDILIGTQMVSKGLDFDNVNIVGILNADNLLNYPDFRAHEKAFQLMAQVSGRAGRKGKRGRVILQTSQPYHPVIRKILENDYQSFYLQQIDERRMFNYPPFCRLISIILKGKNEELLATAANHFASGLRNSFQHRVLGAVKPPISRIKSLYIQQILLKIENNTSPQKIREAIQYYQQQTFSLPNFKNITVYYDVDPLF